MIKLCKPIKKDIWGINNGRNIIHSKYIFLIFKISVNSTQMIVNKEDINETTKQISRLNSKFGPLRAKAFPGRASILLNILKLSKKNIASIHEQIGSPKIGYKAPGTNIPILSDKLMKVKDKSIPIINLAWHISKEIRFYLKKNNINNEIIDIISKNDFK